MASTPRCCHDGEECAITHRRVLHLCLALGAAAAAIAGALLTLGAGTTLTVDQRHPAATPDGPGTEDEPFDSLSAAVRSAAVLTSQGEAVTIRVAPGIYRESVVIDGSHDHAALTIDGAGADQVVLSGAELFNDWRPLSPSSRVVVHHWEEDWGVAPLPDDGWQAYFVENDVSDVARRREAVWVEGQVMRQVLTRDEVLDAAGTFYVDDSGDELLLHPAAPVRPDGVEVATRTTGLDVRNRNDVTVRGITIERVATALQHSAFEIADSTAVSVARVVAEWNSWGGIGLQRVRGAEFNDVAANRNGVIGFSIYRSEDIDLIDVENSENNTWRGVWARYLSWETGAKVFRGRRIRFVNWVANRNAAAGLWLDTDVADVTIEGAVLTHNLRDGLFLEAIQGPVTIRDTVICGNGEDGIVDGKSNGVTVERSRIYGNDDAQVLFSGAPGGRSFTTYDTQTDLTVRSDNWTLRDNMMGAGQDAKLVESHLDQPDWEVVTTTLTSDGNTWTAPEPYEFHAAGDAHDLDGWRGLTGQDEDSTFTAAPPPTDCPG